MSVKSYTLDKLFAGVTSFLSSKYPNENYKIKSFAVSTPCSAEDNFLSEIFTVSFETHLQGVQNGESDHSVKYDLIAKSQLLDPDNPDDIRQYLFHLIFTKEMLMYTEISERMTNLLEGIGLPLQLTFLSPKLHHFYSEGESYSSILMDNLISLGFYLPNTHGDGVTLEECNSIMKAMARFHATSLVIEGQDGILLPQKHEICAAELLLSDSTVDSILPIVEGSYEGIIALSEKYRPDLTPLLKDFDSKESVWNRLCALVKPGTTSFSCLCHGDPRLNNIFISKEDINSVRFIDFQLTRYASPLTDLQYILCMGSTKEFREKYTEQVLSTYFTEFTSVLNNFSSVKLLPSQEAAVRGWTMEKLKEEYEAMTTYGFLIAMTLLPIILLRPGDIDKSVSQMSKEESERFWKGGRKTMVLDVGSKHEDVRKRLFDICDEAFALIKKREG